MLKRSSGILLPLFCLPSNDGIGTMGREAYEFIDFLAESSVKYWQMLPLGVTSFGDSPYSCLSTYAGGFNYIDLEDLVEMGLLSVHELVNEYDPSIVSYEKLHQTKTKLLKKAFARFNKEDPSFIKYQSDNSYWLEDFCLFMAIKEVHNEEAFFRWPSGLLMHDENQINEFKQSNYDLYLFYAFTQYIFTKQWLKLKQYANSKDVRIIGDLPIYVAYDSADVWSHPELFELDDKRVPKRVAGVPPDYFSKTGQLWGNPLYNYDLMKQDNYKWWISRLKYASTLFDVVRLDHFRGFAGYYCVNGDAKDARVGVWEKGPGKEFFKIIKKELKDKELIAEDLGYLTKDVYQLLKFTKLPGMRIVQFGFGGDDSPHLPHNFSQNMIAYSGTHDNQTLSGWFKELNNKTKDAVLKYFSCEENNINDAIIRSLYASSANLVVIPLQDWLGLDDHARINTPSKPQNNWQWRLNKRAINRDLSQKIKQMNQIYYR